MNAKLNRLSGSLGVPPHYERIRAWKILQANIQTGKEQQ